MFHVKHPGWGPGCLLWGSPDLEHGYLSPLVVTAPGKTPPAGAPHRFLDLRSSVGLNQKDQASPAARSANLSSQRTGSPGTRNNPVNLWRGDGGEVPPAEFPFLADQASDFLPGAPLKCGANLLGDPGNTLEIPVNLTVAVEVCFENFPIVDAGLAGLAGVAHHPTPFQFAKVNAEYFTILAARLKVNRRSAAEGPRGGGPPPRGGAGNEGPHRP